MKLEEAINQQKFRHEWQKVTINLLFTHNWLVNKIKKALKKYGVTLQQYNVLRILKGQYPKPITTSVIRQRMLDRMSDASRIVDRLAKKGWVIRQICATDKRLVDITISEKGIALLESIEAEKDVLERTPENLEEEEAIELNRLLDKMRF